MNTQRGQLGDGAVLTVAEACRQLGGRGGKVRRWLVANGLVRDVPGLGRRVSWREVLAAIEGRAAAPPAAEAPERRVVESRPPQLPRVKVTPRR